MRVLFLAHRVPYPPDKGEKIRAYHELDFLASRHEVDLFAFADPQEQEIASPVLSKICARVHLVDLPKRTAMMRAIASLFTAQPFTNAYFYSPELLTAVRAAIKDHQYDVAFVYCSAMAPYAAELSGVPVIVDFVDSDASKWAQYARYSFFPMSWLYKREASLLGRHERKVAENAQLSLASTPLEIEAIDPEKRLPLRLLENGVSMPESDSKSTASEIIGLGKYVVFVGQMDYRPNIDAVCYFTDEILPLVQKLHPDVKFLVVGRNPSRRVRGLARLPGVIVTGAVPEVYPYLRGAIAAVAPFRICQGVQNKILEALAIGLPVVATPRPALAVGGAACESLFIAESPSDFSRMLIKIIENPQHARDSSSKTIEFIRRRFSWEGNLAPLEEWLQEIVNNGKLPALSGKQVSAE
jgi:sugar transferase (PEP-CTERM/EpsH1 system associated)